MKIDLQKIINYKLILLVWIIIWLLFFVRGFVKADYKIFKATIGKSTEEKKAFSMTPGLYKFIEFCDKNTPKDSSFKFEYNKQLLDPVEEVRMMYYLYPRIIKDEPRYIFVFGVPGYRIESYRLVNRLDENSFILEKE